MSNDFRHHEIPNLKEYKEELLDTIALLSSKAVKLQELYKNPDNTFKWALRALSNNLKDAKEKLDDPDISTNELGLKKIRGFLNRNMDFIDREAKEYSERYEAKLHHELTSFQLHNLKEFKDNLLDQIDRLTTTVERGRALNTNHDRNYELVLDHIAQSLMDAKEKLEGNIILPKKQLNKILQTLEDNLDSFGRSTEEYLKRKADNEPPDPRGPARAA